MSTWSTDIIEVDGKLFAYVRLQNDFSGNVSGHFRRIYYDKNGRSYFKADGVNQYIDVRSFKEHQDHIKKALEFYKKYRCAIY